MTLAAKSHCLEDGVYEYTDMYIHISIYTCVYLYKNVGPGGAGEPLDKNI